MVRRSCNRRVGCQELVRTPVKVRIMFLLLSVGRFQKQILAWLNTQICSCHKRTKIN